MATRFPQLVGLSPVLSFETNYPANAVAHVAVDRQLKSGAVILARLAREREG